MNLFEQLSALSTEAINSATIDIDQVPTRQVVAMLHAEDEKVTDAVGSQLNEIAKAIDVVTKVLRRGGSLIYVGAGTSGRLGILDASEMPPTYGVPPEMVRGIIAGGPNAVFKSVEHAEDSNEQGAEALDAEVQRDEMAVVCGISASGRTPFVLGALERARERGFPTILISTNARKTVEGQAPSIDHYICPNVGPEPIAGSTRMNSGTAQKMVVNMITTATMVALGKTFGNVMVDLQLTNEKLVERARKIVMELGGVDYAKASAVLEAADGHVKTALVMTIAVCSRETAEERLNDAKGHVRKALEGLH